MLRLHEQHAPLAAADDLGLMQRDRRGICEVIEVGAIGHPMDGARRVVKPEQHAVLIAVASVVVDVSHTVAKGVDDADCRGQWLALGRKHGAAVLGVHVGHARVPPVALQDRRKAKGGDQNACQG